MTNIDQQLNFLEEFDKPDKAESPKEESTKMKSAKKEFTKEESAKTDSTQAKPISESNEFLDVSTEESDNQKKLAELTSEIEEYLNEEVSDQLNDDRSEFDFQSFAKKGADSIVTEPKQRTEEMTDYERTYWAKVHGDDLKKDSGKKAADDLLAQKYLAEMKARLDKKKAGSQVTDSQETEKLTEESSSSSEALIESSIPKYTHPYDELMPNMKEAVEKKQKDFEEEDKERELRKKDVQIRRQQHDGPSKF